MFGSYKKFLGFFLCLFFSLRLEARFSYRGDVLIFAGYRYLNQKNFSEIDRLYDFVGVAGMDLTYSRGIFQFEVRPEFRRLDSKGAGLAVTDPAHISIKGSRRYLNWGSQLQHNDTSDTEFDFEKINFSFQTEHLEFALGRRPLGLGVLKFLPVWNKFTVVLPSQVGAPLVYNPDNALLRYQQGAWSGAILGIAGSDPQNNVVLGQLNYFGDWIEVQSLFGTWWEHSVAGFALTKDASGLSVRLETLWIGLDPADAEHLFQGGLGFEYAFTEKTSVTLETLFSQNGATSPKDYEFSPTSRFSPYRARAYSLISLDYKFLPTWRLTTGPLANMVDESLLYLTDLRWSVSDDSEFTLQSKIPIGPNRTEFSAQTFQFSDGSYIGYPYVINLYYKAYFRKCGTSIFLKGDHLKSQLGAFCGAHV